MMKPFCVFAALDSFKAAEKAALFAETSFVSTTSTPRDCIAFRLSPQSTLFVLLYSYSAPFVQMFPLMII